MARFAEGQRIRVIFAVNATPQSRLGGLVGTVKFVAPRATWAAAGDGQVEQQYRVEFENGDRETLLETWLEPE